MTRCDLSQRRCQPCEGGVAPLNDADCRGLLAELPGWAIDGMRIVRNFGFRDHYEAMAFINAVAWVSHREDHHPEITIGFKDVRVSYWTHAIDGLSENDFICAAQVSALVNR